MGMVIPARQHEDWGGDLLSFALSLKGQKLEKEKLGLAREGQELEKEKFVLDKEKFASDETYRKETVKYLQEQTLTMAANRKLEEEMKESKRRLAIAQASGLEEEAESLKQKNEFLTSIKNDPEALKSYYMQGAMNAENAQLRTIISAIGTQAQMSKDQADMAAKLSAMQESAFMNNFGDAIKTYANTPEGPLVTFAARSLFEQMKQAKQSPEMIKAYTESYTKALETAARSKTQRDLAEKQVAGEQAKETENASAALIGLMKNDQLWATTDDRLQFIDALASGKTLGKDFAFESEDQRFLKIPLVTKPNAKFKFVPLSGESGSTSDQQSLIDALKALKGE